MLRYKICSSLDRVTIDGFSSLPQRSEFSALRNEPLSFQIAYMAQDEPDGAAYFYPVVETELPIKLYSVGYVPVLHTQLRGFDNPSAPGLYGDLLWEKAINPPVEKISAPWATMYVEKSDRPYVSAFTDCCQSLWFTVNPAGKKIDAGTYPIRIVFRNRTGKEILADITVMLEIADAVLPKQSLLCTNWFYCDCLCDYYNVEPFSPRFYEIFKSFVQVATENGMNMLLLPAFTPPLDTPLEKRRKKIQLVKIYLNNGNYSFDFSELERYIHIAKQCGITHFEHAHLFSQWGALSAPDIYAVVDGKEKQIFGRKNKADGAAYRKFLNAYLPELRACLRKLGVEKKVLFHISDEPTAQMIDCYNRALKSVGNLLDGCMCGDALSDFDLYRQGLVKMPIVATDHIDAFIGKCKKLWCYYTGGQIQNGLSNRLVNIEPERNRVLGIEMYANDIVGFLHWGYNFYYGILSQGRYDPLVDPCGFGSGAGTSFIVYPSYDGRAVPSVRQKVFAEGILDYRALQCYEKTFGKAAVDTLLQAHFGKIDFHVKTSADRLLRFRACLNRALATKTPFRPN